MRVVQKRATIDPFGKPKTSERCNMAAQQILGTRLPKRSAITALYQECPKTRSQLDAKAGAAGC